MSNRFGEFGAAVFLAATLLVTGTARADEAFQPPEILVLGDSQLTFGAGAAFVDFFAGIAGTNGIDRDMTVGVIGVRSSSLAAFTAHGGAAKGAICNVDPKWQVNAGAYGSLNGSSNPYVQIGRGRAYQFCTPGASPFEAMFADGYYRPKLLVMFFLGNATDRWAASPEDALQDVRRTMRSLPPGVACVFMTTAPTFAEKTVRLRLRAQMNIERAFAESGSRCTFVRGYTDATIAENLGNAGNFRRKRSGGVKDPYHPTEAAARRFLALVGADLSRAIGVQMLGR